jgi:hypothetical protein
MTEPVIEVRIPGLTQLDKLELEQALEKQNVEFLPTRTPEGHLGQPDTLMAIIHLTELALPVIGLNLAIYLASKRRRDVLKHDLEMRSGGRVLRSKLRVASESVDAIKAEVVEQLGAAFKDAKADSSDG